MKERRRRQGYFYRTYRKISFILRRRTSARMGSPESGTKDHTIPSLHFGLIAVNSTLFFLLAYVLISLLYGFATALAAYGFDIPAVIGLTDIEFLIKGSSWSADSVKVVFSTGPLTALLLSVILLIVYNLVSEENGILRLLILWMFAHSIVFFLGHVMIGALFTRGFGYVLMYLSAMDTVMMVVTVVALIAMIAAGFRFARLFIISANIWFNELPVHYIRKFMLFQFMIPFLAGNVILFLVKLPEISLFDTGLNLSMVFLLIPVLIQTNRMEDLYFDEDPKRIRVYPILLVTTVVLLVAYRIAAGHGMNLFF